MLVFCGRRGVSGHLRPILTLTALTSLVLLLLLVVVRFPFPRIMLTRWWPPYLVLAALSLVQLPPPIRKFQRVVHEVVQRLLKVARILDIVHVPVINEGDVRPLLGLGRVDPQQPPRIVLVVIRTASLLQLLVPIREQPKELPRTANPALQLPQRSEARVEQKLARARIARRRRRLDDEALVLEEEAARAVRLKSQAGGGPEVSVEGGHVRGGVGGRAAEG
mmetsp:Transcript_17008/g.40759  ORF Transcript_17008/g.40759 Transcript_17008/m.40759 type:complete len:221 (-) Transcript_17008:159-821(-)